MKNSTKGLDVHKAAEFIKTVSLLKNPKASYTLGKDAKMAQILSLLPQDLINKLVKFGLEKRMKQ